MTQLSISQNTEELLDSWIEAERNGVEFPVPFEWAWKIAGHSKKSNAKRVLVDKLTDNVDFCSKLSKSNGGRASRDFWLSCDAFKQFCMMADTEAGRATRLYFIDAEKKWRLVQQANPQLAQEIELQKLKNDGSILEARKELAIAEAKRVDLQLVHFRHLVTATMPEPQQQKILGCQIVKDIEYRDRIIHDGQILNDGSTTLKTDLCKRYGILTKNGKPDYKTLNTFLDKLPPEAFKLSVRFQENTELLREYLPELDEIIENSTRQRWVGE